MKAHHEIAKLLKSELIRLKAKNPSYSLRSLAKRADVHPSLLSDVISGKRKISKRSADKILINLGIAPELREKLLQDLSSGGKSASAEKLEGHVFNELELDEFSVIADWYYFAVLELAQTHDFHGDPKWISKRLKITPSEAKQALKKLLRLQYLKEENGDVVTSGIKVTTTVDVPSGVIRGRHLQNVKLAEQALLEVDVSKRDYSSITMATSLKKVLQAKEKIQKFRRELCEFLEAVDLEERDQVYQFNLQLFPLTQTKEPK